MENRVCPVPPHLGVLRAEAPVPVSPPVTCDSAGTCPLSMLWLLPPLPSQNPTSHRLLPIAVDKCRFGGVIASTGKVISQHSPEDHQKEDLRHYSLKFLAPPYPHLSHWLTFLVFPRPSCLVPIFLKTLLCLPRPQPHFPGWFPDTQIVLAGWTDPFKLLQAALS